MTLLTTTIKHMQQEKAWQKKHEPKAPKKGSLAPDFELFDIDCTSSFRLSDSRDKKPVALVFGSFS